VQSEKTAVFVFDNLGSFLKDIRPLENVSPRIVKTIDSCCRKYKLRHVV